MYCTKCGKYIDDDSIFCQFCGNKINENVSKEATYINESKSGYSNKKKSEEDLLWDKFVDVYDAKDNERERLDKLSSEHVWELIERLYTNAFEDFISENKKELNSQPYKTIESMKNLFLLAVLGGYRLWIAEALLNKKELSKFKTFSIDDLVDQWTNYDFDKRMESISDAMKVCISLYSKHRITIFMDEASDAKELPNALIEELKNSITLRIVHGYFAGDVEAKFRK